MKAKRIYTKKLDNRKVIVNKLEDGRAWLQFLICDGDTSSRISHSVLRDKVVQSDITLSEEAAMAVIQGLISFFELEDNVELNIRNDNVKLKRDER